MLNRKKLWARLQQALRAIQVQPDKISDKERKILHKAIPSSLSRFCMKNCHQVFALFFCEKNCFINFQACFHAF